MSNQITRHKEELVGLGRFELPTSPLSGVRSNQLSYRPNRLGQPVTLVARLQTFSPSIAESSNSCGCLKCGDPAAGSPTATLLRLHPSHESHRGNRPPEG